MKQARAASPWTLAFLLFVGRLEAFQPGTFVVHEKSPAKEKPSTSSVDNNVEGAIAVGSESDVAGF